MSEELVALEAFAGIVELAAIVELSDELAGAACAGAGCAGAACAGVEFEDEVLSGSPLPPRVAEYAWTAAAAIAAASAC